MGRPQHDPQILPMADMTDEWVVRCDCGCGLFEQFARREEAAERAESARAGAVSPGSTAAGGAPEPI